MNALNAALNWLTDVWLSWMAGAPLLALIITSLVAGALMSVVFRYTSSQSALRRVADRSRANLLAMRLFKDEFGVTIRCVGALLRDAGLRIAYALPPMVVMLVPFVLLLTQLAQRYETRPIPPGKPAFVELFLARDAWDQAGSVRFVPPDGVQIRTPPLRDAVRRSIAWEVVPRSPLSGELTWEFGGQRYSKPFVATDSPRLAVAQTRRAGPGFLDRVLYPAEPAFDAASPVQAIELRYPSRSTAVFGWHVPWWLTLLIVSILGALLVKPWVKVQF